MEVHCWAITSINSSYPIYCVRGHNIRATKTYNAFRVFTTRTHTLVYNIVYKESLRVTRGIISICCEQYVDRALTCKSPSILCVCACNIYGSIVVCIYL